MRPSRRARDPEAAKRDAARALLLSEDLALSSDFRNVKRRVTIQSWIIVFLVLFLTAFLPFTKPIYFFYALNPKKEVEPLVGLNMPNLTNQALLSWATTSITEVMTLGFGDMEERLPRQRMRFTEKGWQDYLGAFRRLKIAEKFKKEQLVLTTVPSDTPVIAHRGRDYDGVYKWVVQMPVVMTYATNNNVTQRNNALVTLKIMRVPTDKYFAGIAIDRWTLR